MYVAKVAWVVCGISNFVASHIQVSDTNVTEIKLDERINRTRSRVPEVVKSYRNGRKSVLFMIVTGSKVG